VASFRSSFPIVYCSALASSLAFYRDLLGFRESFRFPDEGEPEFVALDLDEGSLGLAAVTADTKAIHGLPLQPWFGHRFELCVYTDDVDAAIADLVEAGVPVLAEPADQPWGERLAYVADPDGNPVHIAAPIPGAPPPPGS
jgi:lactoylglutathione lyase